MTVQQRNNVQVHGHGPVTMVMAHGFGCDQSMWRFLVPAFKQDFRVVTLDLVGSGGSDIASYDRERYATLHGHADDVLEVIAEFAQGPVVFVGHSVSAMIGMLAAIKAPQLFRAQIMVAPSPCYINDGDYTGGFSREDIDDLLDTMDGNYLGWASNMAPAIMGTADQPELTVELTNSFCRTDPQIARHFARVTFLSDHRADLERSRTPALILQCTDDLIAPQAVGNYMQRHLASSALQLIDNVGHCPHLSAPSLTTDAIHRFLDNAPH